ncbi:MAG: GNAT family N-acetyltransferase [Lachnospiraceae bacterium]|nr:GNAT family N-acetyltransferase [Lachnospiraceae bacterium]
MEKGKFDYKSGNMLIRPTDENDVWNCKWDIFLIDSELTKIGWGSFEGNKESGTVPITIELLPLYRGRGNGSAAIKMFREWAFLHQSVYEVEAYVNKEDSAAISAFSKSGFIYREGKSIEQGGKERYSVTKQKSSWLGLYVVIGIVAGILIGIVVGSVWIGFGAAMLVAVAIGVTMDSREKKKRESVTGKK